MEQIKVYGTKWCPDCHRAKQVFRRLNIQYNWIDIEDDREALEYVRQVNKGCQSVPTIVFPDGAILVEPGNKELEEKLEEIK
ncbi:MAG: NrdH-redoxin [Chloroflexi bacterium RBG_13_57_8]|nr:MAG: NrdH-redoxin [Chloroflexi bacterium RBG_13_57_8]